MTKQLKSSKDITEESLRINIEAHIIHQILIDRSTLSSSAADIKSSPAQSRAPDSVSSPIFSSKILRETREGKKKHIADKIMIKGEYENAGVTVEWEVRITHMGKGKYSYNAKGYPEGLWGRTATLNEK